MKQKIFGQKNHRQKAGISQFVGILALFCCLAAPDNILADGWGVERGRADGGDVAALLVDQLAMKMAQNRIDQALVRTTIAERKAGLLTGSDDADRFDNVHDWWLAKVMGPARAIVANPAASCEEATAKLTALLGMMRQRQLFGLETQFGDLFVEIQQNGYQRCREEALDECVLTGRFDQIISTALGQERQMELLGGSAELEEWVDDSVKQCAVYELQFVSTMKTAQIFNLETVRRSKIEIKFDIPAGGVLNALRSLKKTSDLLKGETLGDVLLDSAKCSQPGLNVVCKNGRILSQNTASILILDMKHREYYIDTSGISKVRTVGDDLVDFDFGGGIFGVDAAVAVPNHGTVPIPMPAIGYGFYMAHKKDLTGQGQPGEGSIVKVENKKRGVYPVLFEFTYADQSSISGGLISDTTEFKLVHKPKPEPLPAKEDKKKSPLKPRKNAGVEH